MLNRIINNEGSGTGEWTLLSRIIWLKATVLAAAGAAWHTVTGAIVSFIAPRAHQLKELVVNIEPVQSGSGDPSPDNVRLISGWTGCKVYSAGKNLIPNIKYQHSSTIVVLGQNANYRQPGLFLKAGTYCFTVDYPVNVSAYIYTASGIDIRLGNLPTVTFTLDKDDYISLYIYSGEGIDATSVGDVQLELGDTVSNYEAYHGETVSVTFPTVNIWDEQWEVGAYNDETGGLWNISDRIRSKSDQYIPVEGNTTYFSHCSTTIKVLCYDEDKAYIGFTFASANTTFTTLANTYFIRFFVYAQYGTTYNNDISINYPSAIHGYYAYGDPMAVYGGTLDVVSGVLTLKKVIDSHKWSEYDGATVLGNCTRKFYLLSVNPKDAQQDDICNVAKMAVSYSADNTHFYVNGPGKRIYMFLPNDTDGNTIISVVYSLETPQTIQLTPQQVNAIIGTNAVWSDAGNVTVTFRGTPIEEPDVEPLQALNLLLGGSYRNDQTPEDVSDDEALEILLGGADR